MLDRHEEAISAFKKAISISPESPSSHSNLAANYMLIGRENEARTEIVKALEIDPKFSSEAYRKGDLYKESDYLNRLIGAMRKAGLPDNQPLPLPDKPSIAVLAFDNLSGDPEQEYFSDGISENIITALSKVGELFVIARNSSFTYKGKPVKVQQVGRELGVRYVLEGSLQKSGDKVRITAQLIDAKNGQHLWADRYDRDLKDIFSLQDEITMKIITALQVKLTEGEQAHLRSRGAKNLAAYLKWLEGVGYLRQFSKEKNVVAMQIAEEVIRMDPEDMRGYSLLAYTNLYDVWLGLSKSSKKSYSKAIELAQKAIDLDPKSAEPYRILAHSYILMRRYDAAVAEAEKALEMEPGSADSHATLGHVLLLSGRHQEAIINLEKATRLNPYPPSWYYLNLAFAYKRSERFQEAVNTFKKSIRNAPNNPIALIGLTVALVESYRIEEARETAKDLLRVNPKFTIEQYIKQSKGKDKTQYIKNAEALSKAGLK
jgi:adenylate cyclase